jgi:ABC-type transport system substrate-binding protein
MQSPASSFVDDIAGAAAFSRGRAQRIAGIGVSGNRITFRLTAAAPDFLSRIAMPFFCAVPEDLPIDPDGVRTPPMAGPYFVADKVPDRSLILRRNPFYRGPRPHGLDEIQFTVNANLNTSYLAVQRGEADYDAAGLPPSAHADLTRRFGINRGRYFVHPGMSIVYVALNTGRPTFRDASMRRAVNFALDRQAILRVAGLNAGSPTDQILPPNVPGFENADIYPFTADVDRAQALVRGRRGRAVLYSGNDTISRNQSLIIQANLRRIGIDVDVRSFPFAVQIQRTGRRGEPFDMNLIGWFADSPDPYDFINVLLDGDRIQAANNVNTAYFDDPAYNRKMAAAARLSGGARYRTYGALDVDISRNAAPLATLYNSNNREFVAARVGCYSFHPVWGSMNLAAACLR